MSQQAGHVEMQIVTIKPSKITLQVSVLMIEYLAVRSYELWMMQNVLYLWL